MHSPTPTTTPRPQEANDQNSESHNYFYHATLPFLRPRLCSVMDGIFRQDQNNSTNIPSWFCSRSRLDLSMLPYNHHHQLTGGQPTTTAVAAAAAAASLLSQTSSQVNSVMNNNFYHSFHATNAQQQQQQQQLQCHTSPTLQGGNSGNSLPLDQSPVQSQQPYQDPGHLAVIFAAAAAAKRASSAQHICRICGKNYINEGSLRKHMNTHPKTSQMSSNLRMWPCTVCQAVFTQESGLLNHMDHMRMDPKHQFFSRAVAANRQTGGSGGLLDGNSPVMRLQLPGNPAMDQTGGGGGNGNNNQASGDENNNLMLHQQQLLSNMDAYNHFREQMQCGQSAMVGSGGGSGNGGNTTPVPGGSSAGGMASGGGGGGGMNDSNDKHCLDENNLMAHQLNLNLQSAAAGLNSTLSQAFQHHVGGGGGDKDDGRGGLLMKDDTSDSMHAAVVVNLAAAMRIQQHQLNCSGIL